MNKEQIKQMALQHGFKLKEQPDGTIDLNPYVYEFARALIANREEAKPKEHQGKKGSSVLAED